MLQVEQILNFAHHTQSMTASASMVQPPSCRMQLGSTSQSQTAVLGRIGCINFVRTIFQMSDQHWLVLITCDTTMTCDACIPTCTVNSQLLIPCIKAFLSTVNSQTWFNQRRVGCGRFTPDSSSLHVTHYTVTTMAFCEVSSAIHHFCNNTLYNSILRVCDHCRIRRIYGDGNFARSGATSSSDALFGETDYPNNTVSQ